MKGRILQTGRLEKNQHESMDPAKDMSEKNQHDERTDPAKGMPGKN